jgi:hypothetical protein
MLKDKKPVSIFCISDYSYANRIHHKQRIRDDVAIELHNPKKNGSFRTCSRMGREGDRKTRDRASLRNDGGVRWKKVR